MDITPEFTKQWLGNTIGENRKYGLTQNDWARAYLAEHARAEAAEAERDRLAARVAELEAAAVPVEWREGVPSVADVRAHEERGGLWRFKDPNHRQWGPDHAQLAFRGALTSPDTPEVCIQNGRTFYQSLTECVWASRSLYLPVDLDGTPVPWPVHGADGLPNTAPVDWRAFTPDEPPLWMVRAHEKRGGWWQTRQVRRFRTYTDERGAYIDSKAGEVDERQEWRCADGKGNPLPWPVHGAEGVADAE